MAQGLPARLGVCALGLTVLVAACSLDLVGTASGPSGADGRGIEGGTPNGSDGAPLENAEPSADGGSHDSGGPDSPGSPYVAAVLARGPLVYYRFEEASGAVAADASGSGKAGTYNQVRYGDPGPRARLGTAAGFDQSKKANVAVPALGDLTRISIECWLKPKTIDTDDSWDTVFNVDDYANGATRFQLQTKDASNIHFSVSGGDTDVYGGGTVTLNEWVYIVVTYDSTTNIATFYKNGVSISTGSLTDPTSMKLTAAHIGANNGDSRAYDGSIDELAIYGDILSGAEVSSHYLLAGP